MRPYIIVAFLAVCVWVVPEGAYASKIFMDPAQVEYNRLDRFYVPIRIDTEGECVNAVTVELRYDQNDINVVDVATGDSIVTHWVEAPAVLRTEGIVRFSGGVVGGYCGRIVGDAGQTNVLGSLVVTGLPKDYPMGHRTRHVLSFTPATQVLLNDGRGTPAPLTLVDASFDLLVAPSESVDTWLTDVRADTVAPELFDITLTNEPGLNNGRWFILFQTSDKQSGVARYEVLETDPLNFGFLKWFPRPSYWVEATSPYQLKDQELQSKILVKAIDKNGNQQVVEYTPGDISVVTKVFRVEVLIMSVGLLVLVVLLAYLVARIRRVRKEGDLRVFPQAEPDTFGPSTQEPPQGDVADSSESHTQP